MTNIILSYINWKIKPRNNYLGYFFVNKGNPGLLIYLSIY